MVDRSIEPADRSVVVAVVDGELTVKRLAMCNNVAELHAENHKYAPLQLKHNKNIVYCTFVNPKYYGN